MKKFLLALFVCLGLISLNVHALKYKGAQCILHAGVIPVDSLYEVPARTFSYVLVAVTDTVEFSIYDEDSVLVAVYTVLADHELDFLGDKGPECKYVNINRTTTAARAAFYSAHN